jgi:hypothetical protein
MASTNDGTFVSGLPPSPVNGASFGKTIGSSRSGTGWTPSFSQ